MRPRLTRWSGWAADTSGRESKAAPFLSRSAGMTAPPRPEPQGDKMWTDCDDVARSDSFVAGEWATSAEAPAAVGGIFGNLPGKQFRTIRNASQMR